MEELKDLVFPREPSEGGRRQPEGAEPQTAVVVRSIAAHHLRPSQSGSSMTWTTQSAVRPSELVKGSSGFRELAVLPSCLIFFETDLILSISQQPSVPPSPSASARTALFCHVLPSSTPRIGLIHIHRLFLSAP